MAPARIKHIARSRKKSVRLARAGLVAALEKRRIEPINRNRKVVRTQRTALRKALRAFFADAAHVAAQQMGPALHRALTKVEPDVPDPADVQAILDALEFGTWVALTPTLERILVTIATDGVEEALRQIGVSLPDIGVSVDQVNEWAVDFARDRAGELVGMSWDGSAYVPNPNAEWAITDGTRELLRGDITDALTEGWGTDELADHLADSYAFSDARAMTIARTELARADVQGNIEGWRVSGVVSGKQWILGDGHDLDDECDDAEAMGVVDIDDDFGGIGDPPAHPNCICDVLPVLDDGSDGADDGS